MARAGMSGRGRGWLLSGCVIFSSLLMVVLVGVPRLVHPQEEEEPKSNRMVCGECPEGYATTGVTSAPSICKEGDPTLVQCVPLGSRLLSVCGECPSGYSTVGSSTVPSRCGGQYGGTMSQCQRDNSSFLTPERDREFCQPDCPGKLRMVEFSAIKTVPRAQAIGSEGGKR